MQVSNFYKNVDSYKLAGHPAYEFEQNNGNSKVIGLSHHEVVRFNDGRIAYYHKLNVNPDKCDNKISYMSRNPFIVSTNSLKNKKVDWQFDDLDKPYVEKVKNKKPF